MRVFFTRKRMVVFARLTKKVAVITLNIIFVQVYPCDKHLHSQKLEWKCFVHFSVKDFL